MSGDTNAEIRAVRNVPKGAHVLVKVMPKPGSGRVRVVCLGTCEIASIEIELVESIDERQKRTA